MSGLFNKVEVPIFNYSIFFNKIITMKKSLLSISILINIFTGFSFAQEVLIDEYQTAGSYSKTFNGSDLPSGMYVYKLTSGNYSESNKMLILK